MSDQTCPHCVQGYIQDTGFDRCGHCNPDYNNLEGPPPTAEERAAMARELDAVAPTPGDKFRLMLGQRPTPRTDKAEYQIRLGRYRGRVVRPEFARQLERELAEAQDIIAQSLMSLPVGYLPNHTPESLPSRINHLVKELAETVACMRLAEAATIRALHERNEAREEVARLQKQVDGAKHCLTAIQDAKEQRDRLAEALRGIKDRALDETVRLHPDADAKGCVDDCLEWAESALDSLEGGER